MKLKHELEAERTKIDLLAWQIGVYTRHAVGSLFDSRTKYPAEPLTITADRERNMTGADHAARFAAWAAQHAAGRKATHKHQYTHKSRGEGHESK